MKLSIILLLSITFIISYAQSTQDEYTVGEISWGKLSYPLKNNTAVTIQVTDPDMNKISSYNDIITAFAYSDSYQEGIALTLYETGKNSGVFERTFVISDLRSAPNILYTQQGDTITAKYVDKTLPPPYSPSDELELVDTSIVGNRGPPLERVPASSSRAQDLQGNVLKTPTINVYQQVLLFADLKNQQNREQDFAFLVQVQDEQNVTVSLGWITGTLTPLQSFSASQSWIPQEPGRYTATFFVWQSLDNPSALSPPITLDVEVLPQTQPISYSSSEKTSEQIYFTCKKDDDCTIQLLQQLSIDTSTEQMLGTINELVTLYEQSGFYCHPNAHHLGEFLLGYVKGDFSEAIKHADYRCASGILHGLTENTIPIQTLLYGTDVDDVDIVTPCDIVESHIGTDAKAECIHGMGHSLTKAYDYDMASAVEKCDVFSNGNERYMCQGGLFMQNINKYWDDQGGDFDDSDYYHPCNKIDESKAALCYRYQGLYFLKQSNFDENFAYDLCSKIENSGNADLCFKGIATHIATRNFENLDSTVQMCKNFEKMHQPICVRGVVESLTRFVSVELAEEFCDSVSEDLASACFERLDQLLEQRY